MGQDYLDKIYDITKTLWMGYLNRIQGIGFSKRVWKRDTWIYGMGWDILMGYWILISP